MRASVVRDTYTDALLRELDDLWRRLLGRRVIEFDRPANLLEVDADLVAATYFA